MRFIAAALLSVLFFPRTAPAGPPESSYVKWGRQMLQEKKYDQAIKYFGAAIRHDSRNAAAYKGLGYAFAYKNDRTKALDYLSYAAKLDPEDRELEDYLAKLKGKPESSPTAETAVAAAPESHPWMMGSVVAVLGTLMLLAF